MKKYILLLALLPTLAFAQVSGKAGDFDQTSTPVDDSQLSANVPLIDAASNVWTGTGQFLSLDLSAPTAGGGQFRLIPSAAVDPSAPDSGDLWWNGTNLYFYNGSGNTDLLAGGGVDPDATNTFTRRQNIDITVDETALFVQGNTSQTNDIVFIETGNGTDLVQLTASGTLLLDNSLHESGGGLAFGSASDSGDVGLNRIAAGQLSLTNGGGAATGESDLFLDGLNFTDGLGTRQAGFVYHGQDDVQATFEIVDLVNDSGSTYGVGLRAYRRYHSYDNDEGYFEGSTTGAWLLNQDASSSPQGRIGGTGNYIYIGNKNYNTPRLSGAAALSEGGSDTTPHYSWTSYADTGFYTVQSFGERIITTVDSWKDLKEIGHVQTTDDTPTAVTTFDDLSASIDATVMDVTVIGVESGNGNHAAYRFQCLVYDNATNYVIQGQTPISTIESNADWDAVCTVSGDTVSVSVTGVALTTIEWKANVTYTPLSDTGADGN